MAYEKTVWKDHVVERPKTYRMVENADGTVTLVPETGQVIQQGTALNAENLNHIEDTLAEHDEALGKRLPTSGGTMTGNIDLGGNALTNVKSPAAATDAATKGYVDGKRLVLTATIPASWTGSAEPYTQTISVPGILATDTPHIMPVYTDPNYSVTLAQIEGWSKIVSAFSGDGTIAFYCRPDKPAVAIPIQIEVMR